MRRSPANLPPIQQVIESVLQSLGFSDYKVSLESSVVPGHVTYNITGSDAGLLIGKNGKNLEALSKIVREIIISRSAELDSHFELENYVIDVDGYQQAEVSKLLSAVEDQITALSAENSIIELTPMPAFQRRLIHAYVQNKDGLESQSEGFGRQRRVIIKSNE